MFSFTDIFYCLINTNTYLQNIKEGLEGHAVAWYPEVFDLVFPNVDKEQANKCKVCEWKAQQKKNDPESAEEED